jgi:hypothetical protein
MACLDLLPTPLKVEIRSGVSQRRFGFERLQAESTVLGENLADDELWAGS